MIIAADAVVVISEIDIRCRRRKVVSGRPFRRRIRWRGADNCIGSKHRVGKTRVELLNVVRGTSWKAQLVTPPPVDHIGLAPEFTMLLMKTKFFIGVVATMPPITNSMVDGNAVI